MNLVKPLKTHKKDVMKFREELLKETNKISGGVALEQAINYDDWLNHKYVPHYGKVDELVYLAYEGNILVGISDIRLTTNDFVLTYAGQIGYSVMPTQRGKGFATQILKLTLQEARKHNFDRVLVTCNEPNIASSKVIERNGGVLESIIPHPGFPDVKRYYISL